MKGDILIHPTLNTNPHHVLFQTACTECIIIDNPNKMQKTIPAASDGTYPYEVFIPSTGAWQPVLSCCSNACWGVRV